MTYQIGKLPYAALIDKAGTLRAKGLVNSREHLDSLFEVEHLKQRHAAGLPEQPAACPRTRPQPRP